MTLVNFVKDWFFLPIRTRSNFVFKPKFINFLITYRCNSRCKMCGIWKKSLPGTKKALPKELSQEEIISFFRKNKEFLSEVKHIGFSGGEAVLRMDLVEIIKGVKRIFPKVATGFQTNGLSPKRIESVLKKIKKFYPGISLAISLDGLAKINDSIRGVKGAFKKAEETFKVAQKLGIKRITCGMTVGSENVNQIKAVRDFVEKQGAEFSCFLPDKADYFNNSGLTLNISKETKKTLSGIILKNFSYHYFMDNIRLQLEGKRKRRLPCYSGHTSLVIDPYGNIKPCILRRESFGNIRENASLRDILYNKEAVKLKKRLKKCTCWNQCEISTSVIVSPWDLFWWFIFYCRDKRKFLKVSFKKAISV